MIFFKFAVTNKVTLKETDHGRDFSSKKAYYNLDFQIRYLY